MFAHTLLSHNPHNTLDTIYLHINRAQTVVRQKPDGSDEGDEGDDGDDDGVGGDSDRKVMDVDMEAVGLVAVMKWEEAIRESSQ